MSCILHKSCSTAIYISKMSLVDLIFPKMCLSCQSKKAVGDLLCLNCQSTLSYSRLHPFESHPMRMAFADFEGINAVSACFLNQSSTASATQLVQRLKYKEHKSLSHCLVAFSKPQLDLIFTSRKVDAIIPVPMHPLKHWIRGYNQAEEIALAIGEAYHCPVEKHYLRATFRITPQAKKSKLERLNSSSFIIRGTKPLQHNIHLLLVDDVCTTGTTLSHCIRALSEKNDISISVFSILYTPSEGFV